MPSSLESYLRYFLLLISFPLHILTFVTGETSFLKMSQMLRKTLQNFIQVLSLFPSSFAFLTLCLALKEAATSLDCVSPSNPLQIDFRTQYRSEPVDFSCLARVYGLTWPKDAEEVMKLCPGTPFLRSFPVSIVSFFFFLSFFLSFFFSFFSFSSLSVF